MANKKYVAISVKDYNELEANEVLSDIPEKSIKNNSGSILLKCTKAEAKYMKELLKEDCELDFTLVCGKISYYVEENAALDILAYQHEIMANVDKAYREYMKSWRNYGIDSEITINAENEYDKLRKAASKKMMDYIEKNHRGDISPYAFVNLYHLVSYEGSYYGSCEEVDICDEFNKYRSFAKGDIDYKDFVSKLEELGYIDRIHSKVPSISDPIKFMRDSLQSGSTSYFGFAIPHTPKALKRRGRTSK